MASRVKEMTLRFIAKHVLGDGDLGFLANEYMKANNIGQICIKAIDRNKDGAMSGTLTRYYQK